MKKKRILVVEDESIVARDIEVTLRSLGYAVPAVTSSGDEAIKKAGEAHPDLVLMDIRLKGDVDGVQAAKEIRARFNIPVVYLTAYADNDTLEQAKITEPYGYILKPFQERELHTSMEVALYKHEMEGKLVESQRLYEAMANVMQAGVFIVQDGKFVLVNPSFQESTGYTEDELLGMTSLSLVHPEDREMVREKAIRVLKERLSEPYEFRAAAKSGETKWVIETIASVWYHGKRASLGCYMDITERKQAEEKLKQAAEEWETTFNSITDFVSIQDKDFKLVKVNKAHADLCKMTPEELVGKTCYEVVHGTREPCSGCPHRQTLKTKKPATVELFEPRLGVYLQISTSPIFDNQGEVIGTVHIVNDITERKRAEEQLKTSLKEKEVLLKEIHHRVKNNLQLISSMFHLQSGYGKNKQVLRILADNQNRVRSLALIHEKLYRSGDLARIAFGEYLRDLVANLLHSYTVGTGAVSLKMAVDEISLDIDTAIPCSLIINELVTNSLKHAFPEGREGEISIDFHSHNDNKLTLVVSDNGVGFPKGLDFRSTESFGLQLAISLVNQLGAAIELDSSAGTAFEITFAVVGGGKKQIVRR